MKKMSRAHLQGPWNTGWSSHLMSSPAFLALGALDKGIVKIARNHLVDHA